MKGKVLLEFRKSLEAVDWYEWKAVFCRQFQWEGRSLCMHASYGILLDECNNISVMIVKLYSLKFRLNENVTTTALEGFT
jgi:hypothetical protein